MRGRKPKPTKIKLLEGNLGKRKLNDAEPEFALSKKHKAPEDLSEKATKEWRRLYKILSDSGVLTDADIGLLDKLIEAFEKDLQITEEFKSFKGQRKLLIRTPQGGLVPNPLIRVQRDNTTLMLKLYTELGLTPSSRSRLTADKPNANGKRKSELKKRFFNSGK